ncbi:hypothetical protein SB748_24255 [Rhizobium sp. SIMBA_035]
MPFPQTGQNIGGPPRRHLRCRFLFDIQGSDRPNLGRTALPQIRTSTLRHGILQSPMGQDISAPSLCSSENIARHRTVQPDLVVYLTRQRDRYRGERDTYGIALSSINLGAADCWILDRLRTISE